MAISLHGLDLSFLENEENRLRKEPEHERQLVRHEGKSCHFLPDLDRAYGGGFESPIDGTYITSRSQLREHNKRHNVIQTGDVRGQQLRDQVKRHMRYNKSLRSDPSFSWIGPRKTSGGNLTEI